MSIYEQLLLQATYRNEAGDGDGGGGGGEEARPTGDDAGGEGGGEASADQSETTLAGGEDDDAGDVEHEGDQARPEETDGTTSIAGGEDGDDDGEEKAGKDDGEGEDKGGAPEGGYSEFTLPEGFQGFNEQALEGFVGVATELGLDQDGAQKMVDVGAQLVAETEQRVTDAMESAYQAQQQAWIRELREDPELGGANMQDTVKSIRAGRKAMAGSLDGEVRAWFNTTGIGNHPLMMRMLYTVGTWVRGDRVLGEGKGGEIDAASNMFPTMRDQQGADS